MCPQKLRHGALVYERDSECVARSCAVPKEGPAITDVQIAPRRAERDEWMGYWA
jgi:hypothetical protein